MSLCGRYEDQSASLVDLTPAPSSAMPRKRSLQTLELPPKDDLIGVVTFSYTLMATELLAYLMGCIEPSYCDYSYHGLHVTSDRWCTLCVLVCAFRKTAVGSSVGTCGDRKNGLWCRIEFNLSGSLDTTVSS